MRVGKSNGKILKAGAYLAHRRIGLFWTVAVIALAGPWALKGCKLPATVMEGCTVSSVYDGDTLRAECGGEKVKVRLYCIDAPEMGQKPWGRESRDHLRELVPRNSAISLKIYDTDKYGRRVAEVLKIDENQNALMVKDGHAAVYRTYCTRANREYYRGEEQARQGKLGIWEKSGLQQRPWEWRSNGS